MNRKKLKIMSLFMLLIMGIIVFFCAKETFAAGTGYDNAQEISLNESVYGVTGNNSQYYTFSIPSSGVVSFSFAHEKMDTYLQGWRVIIYDSERSYIYEFAVSKGDTETQSYNIGLPAGKYYIMVASSTSEVVGLGYQLGVIYKSSTNWEKEQNNSFETANSIDVNTIANGNNMSNSFDRWGNYIGESDYFSFNIENDGYIVINLSHEKLEAHFEGWGIYLFDSEHSQVYSFTSYQDVASTDSCKLGLPKGKYYVMIRGVAKETGGVDYALNIKYTQSNTWEKEQNNSFETANSIDVNTIANGNNMSNSFDRWGNYIGESDYFSFNLENDGYIVINLSHEKMEAHFGGWGIYLFDSEHSQLYSFTSYQDVASTDSCKIGLPARKYYVMVSGAAKETEGIDYALNIKYTKSDMWEKEYNDSFDKANVIAVGAAQNGCIRLDKDVDYYKISLPYDGYYKISLDHEKLEDSKNYWKMDLYNSERVSLANLSVVGNKKSSYSVEYCKKGIYYVQVSQVEWTDKDYSLKISYTTPKGAIVSAASNSPNRLALKWLKLDSVNGYEVLMATDSKFTKNKKLTVIKNAKTIGKTFSGLTANKTYYVKLRGYRIIDGKKYYGDYSKTKKVKIKAPAQTIKLNVNKKTLKVGKSYTLKVTGTSKKVTWSSNKKSVVTISKKGKIKAKKAGKAVITAKIGNKKLKCNITVKASK